jgi:hypothetical protein
MRLLGGRHPSYWATPALSLLPTSTAAFQNAILTGYRNDRKGVWGGGSIGRLHRRFASSRHQDSKLVNTLESTLDWSDRIGLQDRYTLKEKGWRVNVDWRTTPYGAGLFSKQDIPKGTILRTGILGVNLKEFKSIAEIDDFCQQQAEEDFGSIATRRDYVKDYLWGFSKFADEGGYPLDSQADVLSEDGTTTESRRFYGMWIPGNGLNHSPEPNTVYRLSSEVIDLVALMDICTSDELFDDYRRHGSAPEWLKDFAQLHNVTLNFADCNDFVLDA